MSLKSRWIAAFVAALAVSSALLIACGGDDDEAVTPAATVAATQAAGGGTTSTTTVRMADFAYSPTQLTARAGQAVSLNLVNGGAMPHTFTITGVSDSGRIEANASKPLTFTPTAAGTLTFFCTIHGQAAMSGTIAVSAQ